MMIKLPTEHKARRAAMDWLMVEGIGYLPLFQAVSIDDKGDADRFKAWLDQSSKTSSKNY